MLYRLSLLFILTLYPLLQVAFSFPLEHASPRLHSAVAIRAAEISARAYENELATIQQRRISRIVGAVAGSPDVVGNLSTWIQSQRSDGTWDDIDYTRGCDARRANWPAADHWSRLVALASAWNGGVPGQDPYVKNSQLLQSILTGMNWWFDRDYTNLACLDSGGSDSCPCDDDETLWNTNWFSNVILIPRAVAKTCLLVGNVNLSSSQRSSCSRFPSRSYAGFYRTLNGVGPLTGANALDVASLAIDWSLYARNTTLADDAYTKVHQELPIRNEVRSDGIRADGSYGQHTGLLYNGNYGKDFANDILDLETAAAGTTLSAELTLRSAFETLINGDRWMIFRNTVTDVLHFDFSVLPRFISFPVADKQATASININITELWELGAQWGSGNLTNAGQSLALDSSSANAGDLVGVRIFYANDYLVHRGNGFVTSLKMFSTRTKNTECTNDQNPLGFHLSDGTLYTYVKGNEYEDIAASWNWNRIPGTTTDYDATPLNCQNTKNFGVESFVGGLTDSKGVYGIGAMRYTNPVTKSMSWQKAWFLLPDGVQRIVVNRVSSKNSKAPVISVLDQRLHSGQVSVFGQDNKQKAIPSTGSSPYPNAKAIWHGGVGYSLDDSAFTLNVETGSKTGDWSKIGTSTQPPTTVDLFSAWLAHDPANPSKPLSYTAFPGTDLQTFQSKRATVVSKVQTIQNDKCVSAVYDQRTSQAVALVVFWESSCASVKLPGALGIVKSDQALVLIINTATNTITIADPSQALGTATVTVNGRAIAFTLPKGGLAGASVSKSL